MSAIGTLIEELFLAGARVWVEEGSLRYRAPGGTPTEERRARLAAHKEAILTAVPAGELLPLSFPQQRLWFLFQLLPGSPLYNNPEVARLRGRLDVPALSRSLDEVQRRHEVLRATFPGIAGEPVQVVGPPRPLRLAVVDLRQAEGGRPGRLALQIARQEARRPFDLEREPPLRAVLLRSGEEEHLLVLVIHHIAFDARSVRVLCREVEALYGAFSAGRPSPLPPLAAQYRDFVGEQRRPGRQEALRDHLVYWRGRLAGSRATLALPFDRPQPPAPTFRGRQQFLDLGRGLADQVKALSQRQGATLYMTLLAAFQVLLGRWSGQEDLNVGCPITGRGRAELAPLIGFFANNLVLRGDLSGDPRFDELLERTREAVLGAFRHQDLPFETLVEALQPDRQTSRTPLFQAVFQLLDASGWSLELQGLEAERVVLDSGTAKFDLALTLFAADGELTARFESRADRFEAATTARLAGHLRVLLSGIVAGPRRHLQELPLLAEPERHQALCEWNDTASDCPRHRTIQDLFAEQAACRPDAVAVVAGDVVLTYAGLDRMSERIARTLRRLGVGPETPVGICVERSAPMVAALLGILRAGGTYVPLDPANPAERLAFMLDDSGVEVVLLQRELLATLPPGLFAGGSREIRLLTLEAASLRAE